MKVKTNKLDITHLRLANCTGLLLLSPINSSKIRLKKWQFRIYNLRIIAVYQTIIKLIKSTPLDSYIKNIIFYIT